MKEELVETGRPCELLTEIGGGLDRYLEFKHADALQHRDPWIAALGKPLPPQGVGIDQVVRDLLLHVIPNGSPVPRPGFTSYVTTGATSAAHWR